MAQELVSIILPAYNCEEFIGQAIDSILDQTYENIQILIADDGSVDNTRKIIDSYNDSRIVTAHNNENHGVVFTRNKLLALANGEYLTFQDADDYSLPKRIEQQLSAFEQNEGLFACGTQYIKVSAVGEQLFLSKIPTSYRVIRDAIPKEFHFLCASMMIRRSVYEEMGGYNVFFERNNFEDLYWLGQVALNYRTINLSEHLYIYRYNPKSLSKSISSMSPRKIYYRNIVTLLLDQSREKGTNFLEEGEISKLDSYKLQLEEVYAKDPSSQYVFLTGHFLYWNDFSNAFKSSVLAVYKMPFKWSNYMELLFVIKSKLLSYLARN